MSVEMITIFVSIQTAILHGHQLGDYFPNQVASSKILSTMVTKMFATWRVVHCFITWLNLFQVVVWWSVSHSEEAWPWSPMTGEKDRANMVIFGLNG